ncbi:MAG TPA: chromosome segregation protein SMC [Burkholderiales bacterium]|nr:chromosome segregation protein SMC [Burkholderiales bacterium]
MRLTSIKLAGFKSFVDPTNVGVPGQLVGIVGPNGCGKSNIIDAVRWVLGESKASALRGESMQDVIFNGSSSRKPVARASVELVFDNTDGKAHGGMGQWATYSEIAVKRLLTRQGESSYFINNQQVRKRDVQDIFLGTGLGARAYAIIEQGMISRVIEAKPEELRVFLEEAAGVSRYKERRKETESRLSSARDNLTRVEDIRRELDSQLVKLEEQATVAQSYRALTAEQTEKQHLLWLLKRNEAGAEQEKHARDIERVTNELEGETASLRNFEKQVEEMRAAHYAAGDRLHGSQGELYNANAEVSRLEAEIKGLLDTRQRLSNQVTQLAAQEAAWTTQGVQTSADIEHWKGEAEAAAAKSEETAMIAAERAERLPEAETAARDAQERLVTVRGEVMQTEQQLQLEGAHQGNAQRALENLGMRRERLVSEQKVLNRPDEEAINRKREERARREAELEERELQLQGLEEALPGASAERDTAQSALQNLTREAHETEAKIAALKSLQESVQKSGKLQPWLEKHELAGLPRLWQRLHAEPGWEAAIESVLRERLAALEIRNLDWAKGFFNDAPPAKLAFVTIGAVETGVPAPAGLTPLISHIQIDDANVRGLLSDWLTGCYAAESVEEAYARRAELPAGGVFITRAGHQIGRQAVSFYAADSEQAGMLARQNEIDNLGKQLKAKHLHLDDARANAARTEAAVTRLSGQIADNRPATQSARLRLHELQLDVVKDEEALARYNETAGRIEAALAEITAHEEEEKARLIEAEEKFAQLDEATAAVQERLEESRNAAESADSKLAAEREAVRQTEREAQEAEFHARQCRAKIAELENSARSIAAQIERVAAEAVTIRAELDTMHDEAMQNGLQEALDLRMEREQALARVRTELDGLTTQLRGMDEERMKSEQKLDPLRNKVGDLRLKEQAARLAQEQFATQLAEAQADEAVLTPKLEGARAGWLGSEVSRLAQEIAALGAVNLAALEELGSARERKGFLDAQFNDLTEAVTTLEDAIRRIDKETRELLKETFDAVNKNFGELFPALFGGGEAKLIMTGDEILDAGVQVMAQPPGKKNASIHLLSGGEKALTATSLVFALFRLNPAPFCLLDEVDAPLDDPNTERFCRLVKKMAEETQFVFISHNKIAMEMATQLIGVTQQELGVSRIVAVDMEEAVRLREPMAA